MPLTPLLFLSPRVPWPPNTGAKIRTRALLAALEQEFAVDYAGFLQPELPEDQARERLAACRSVSLYHEPATRPAGRAWLGARTLLDARPATIAKYWNPELAVYVHNWAHEHPGAIVHADHLHMAHFLGGAAGARLCVCDEHNVETNILDRLAQQTGNPVKQAYLRLQARRMRRWEARVARDADRVLAVSEGDAQQLRQMAPETPVWVIRNGVDLDYFTPPPPGRPRRPRQLVFTGSMNWLPNQDGVVWFASEVFPLLKAREGADGPWRLDVVGHAPPPAVCTLASDRIRVTGTVDDVRPYVHDGQVFIVPLRIGGGSRLKILEAFAMGIPVVSTTVGCEGLDVQDGRQLLVADSARDFAEAITRIASDSVLAHALTQNASRHVREVFSWRAIGGQLIEGYRKALEEGGAPDARR